MTTTTTTCVYWKRPNGMIEQLGFANRKLAKNFLQKGGNAPAVILLEKKRRSGVYKVHLGENRKTRTPYFGSIHRVCRTPSSIHRPDR